MCTVLVLIKCKMPFTQGNSKIAVVLNNAHQIFIGVHAAEILHACAFLMETRIQSINA